MNTAALICAYADRFHRAVGSEQHVASPLGAWIVLALAAPASAGIERARLEDVLGCGVDEASELARGLLASPHPVVALAAAAWCASDGAELRSWLDTLGPDIEVGPVPSQAGADDWARRHTFELIKKFPLDIGDAVLVLASAIATKTSWQRPFDVVQASQLTLPRATGFGQLQRLLRDAPDRGNDDEQRNRDQAIVATSAGLMAVHGARSGDDDLVVVSVIADPSVPPTVVLAAAHPLAIAVARGEALAGRVSLFDLPLGLAHSWTVDETAGRGRDEEWCLSTLPAWSVEAEHNLMKLDDLGFAEAGEALRALVNGLPPKAKQVALARYTRSGFEAAAVTAIAVSVSASFWQPAGRLRVAHVEYTHPYAVVAVARVADRGDSGWSGLPLFSAWITEGVEAD